MPTYSLEGDTSGLPTTKRGGMPYEIHALQVQETWGAGNSGTTLLCRQLWDDSATWLKYMLGEVEVAMIGSQSPVPTLRRHIPEPVRYGEIGNDDRVQHCTSAVLQDQGGRSDGGNMGAAGIHWPEVDWVRYQIGLEALPYLARSDDEIADIVSEMTLAGADGFIGARELLRYVIRSRKTYSREQPIPAASTAGGFKVINDADPTKRRAIGQVGFRSVTFADVSYTWVRVPIGWPPPIGWTPSNPTNPWPPTFNPVAAAPLTVKRARDSYLNTINSDWFDVASPEGFAWAPKTLLFTGYDDSFRYWDAAGKYVCDVVYNFKFKEGGWITFLDATGAWVEVSLDGTSTGTRPYQTNNLNNLFQYAAT